MKYDKETLEAVERSIDKYKRYFLDAINKEERSQYLDNDYGEDCPLCVKFYPNAYMGNPCGGCPIADYVNHLFCANTPYNDFYNSIGYDELIKSIRKMINFLKEVKEYTIKNME